MNNLSTAYEMHLNEEEKKSANRLLKRLRLALLIWLVIFVITLIWFSLTSS